MNRIVKKEQFSEKVYKLEVEAPLIAKARKAGHFVIVRVGGGDAQRLIYRRVIDEYVIGVNAVFAVSALGVAA